MSILITKSNLDYPKVTTYLIGFPSTHSDSNGIRTYNDLGRKRTLNHLAKLAAKLGSLAKPLSVRLRTK